jgi:hypothetical protein
LSSIIFNSFVKEEEEEEEEEEYPCLSATLQYRVLSEDSFEKPDISSYNYC